MFSLSTLISPGETLLVTDELASPGDFILHQSAATYLKERDYPRCIVLLASGDLVKWRSVSGRLNINVTHHLALQSLEFVDVSTFLQSSDAVPGQSSTLKHLHNHIRDLLKQSPSESTSPLVILDDIIMLEWIGYSTRELSLFSRALCALCRQTRATLILRHHIVTPGEPDDLMRHLLQLCAYHIDVVPLSSGRSGAVSGQIALHAGPGPIDPKVQLISRDAAVLYRLTDTGAVFFDRGTSEGLL